MKKLMNFKGLLLSGMMMLGMTAFAQDGASTTENYDQGFRLGFGLNGGVTTGDYFNFALGGDVRLQYDLSQRTSLTLTTGYTHLFGEDNVPDLGYIPAKAGFKAFVWGDRFYVLGEAGAGFAVTNDYNETTFLWAPGIGYANDVIDLSLRYEGANDFKTDQVALRIAYGFKL
ncbi:hypothetical protein HYN59_09210 [Flavobacterium album]|uniref:Outer membrane protein beta-barrel domain-containing protein n=1 Tax=Flavobacterium album TaxID=2175091 RepID=A0A2S1QY30_9FLAO|nr:hypothetical protein [Flavobacterium album]AWH85284.1 hypothetical protein HYN59_09210 [Flavobacterium album]